MRRPRLLVAAAAALAVLAPACSSGNTATQPQAAAEAAGGVVVAPPAEAAKVLESPPAGLVVLDVRTPEEFAQGHLPGAVNLDFYAPDFRDQLKTLDPTVPYLLYCHSGNRSSQARAMMVDLGFTTITDVQGGIAAWAQAGLPIVTS